MKAIVLGATGATGNDLLNNLLTDDYFDEVHIFVRRIVTLENAKLTVHVVDFENYISWQHLISGDIAFSCMGTTLKDAGSKTAQWKVDYDYQYQFAKAAKENGVDCFALVSAAGANPDSFWFYNKMKGKLEKAIKALLFKTTLLFNPGPLERKNTTRKGESTAVNTIRVLNKWGLFKNLQPITTQTLAQAMINTVKSDITGITHYNTRNIIHNAEKN